MKQSNTLESKRKIQSLELPWLVLSLLSFFFLSLYISFFISIFILFVYIILYIIYIIIYYIIYYIIYTNVTYKLYVSQ